MRGVSSIAPSFPLYLHDGFDLQRFSNFVADRSDFVVEDHHSYFVFTAQDSSEPVAQHESDVEGGIGGSFAAASQRQRNNLVIDEWSCAITDQSLSSAPNRDEAFRDFCTAQLDTYTNTTAGWGFWGRSLPTHLIWSELTSLQPTARKDVVTTPVGASSKQSETLFHRAFSLTGHVPMVRNRRIFPTWRHSQLV